MCFFTLLLLRVFTTITFPEHTITCYLNNNILVDILLLFFLTGNIFYTFQLILQKEYIFAIDICMYIKDFQICRYLFFIVCHNRNLISSVSERTEWSLTTKKKKKNLVWTLLSSLIPEHLWSEVLYTFPRKKAKLTALAVPNITQPLWFYSVWQTLILRFKWSCRVL